MSIVTATEGCLIQPLLQIHSRSANDMKLVCRSLIWCRSLAFVSQSFDPKNWSTCLNGIFFPHLEQIRCITSVTYFIKTAQAGSGSFRAEPERLFFLLVVSGDNDRLARPVASVQTMIHRDSDCTWAPIQTACHEKIFTPQFRHYSHTTMPLVDKEPSLTEIISW